MTTGIFAWIAAHAAEEQRQQGKRDITPYWRTLKSGGVINPKYSREIIDKIEDLIEKYYLKALTSSEPKAARGYIKLITDFLDVYSEMHYLAGKCSFLANRFSVTTPAYVVGIEHLLRAVQNRLQFKYAYPELKELHERWAKGFQSIRDMPLLEIPRPRILRFWE